MPASVTVTRPANASVIVSVASVGIFSSRTSTRCPSADPGPVATVIASVYAAVIPSRVDTSSRRSVCLSEKFARSWSEALVASASSSSRSSRQPVPIQA